ncbi:MAG: formate dehydrogenase subunit beta [Planctomycetes bacterium]|nr:formate dehydrogenase subunit beta [Planctomycetota bacterium]
MSGHLDVRRISATGEGSAVREGEGQGEGLCMLIDTTTCIGCKACEIACVEWNDLRVEPEYAQRVLDSYQTMPDMTPSYWNLIRFDEVPVGADRKPLAPEAAAEGAAVQWLMRKDMCMHCAEPGCLIACPAEGAIVQYTSGIVDFAQEHCIGCGYCMTGCPFDIPKFDPVSRRVYKCTMCSDRVSNGLGPACVKACPTGCLEFGSKGEMLERARRRAGQVRAEGFDGAGVYDPPGVGGTGVIYVLHHADKPELYGGLPRDPRIDPQLRLWKGPLKVLGGVLFGLSLAAAALHYLKVGRRRVPEAREARERRELHEAREPHEARAEGAAGREIVRYTLSERAVHWTVAFTFLYLALTGLGLFTPKLSWLLTLLGGGQVAREWHPIVGCVFTGAVLVQLLRWLRDLTITPGDRLWLRRIRDYMAGRDAQVPPSGRFNAGQKLLFWLQVLLGLVLLASGVPIWFPEEIPRWLRLWAVVIHSASAVASILALILHVYMALFVTQGALRAMVEGKVSEEWARHHHAKWAEEKLRE